MMSIVDTHTHVDLDAFDPDRDAVLRRALAAGVHALVLIGFKPERWRRTDEMCRQYPFLVRSAGMHPNEAAAWTDEIHEELDREIGQGDVVAVGETGLDFFRNDASPDLQRKAFEAQIELAKRHALPIVIHQRSAGSEVLDLLRPHAPVRGVMHAFGGDERYARECLDLGLHLGIGGIATYPKSVPVRDALRVAPLDRLVTETDSPYLAPQSKRGGRNEPADITAALDVIATIKGLDLNLVASQTTSNACALFGRSLERALVAGQEEAATCA